MANNLGIYHIAERPDLYEPMRNNVFELVVHDIDNLKKVGVTTDDETDYITDAQEVLRYTVSKVSIPNFTQKEFEIKRGNMAIKAAGTISFDSGSLEVIDYIGSDSRSVLMAWQRLAGDPLTEKVGRMKDYKKRCTLMEYSCDFELIRYWDIYGAWISSVEHDENDVSGGDDKRVIKATIIFDKAIMHAGNDFE